VLSRLIASLDDDDDDGDAWTGRMFS